MSVLPKDAIAPKARLRLVFPFRRGIASGRQSSRPDGVSSAPRRRFVEATRVDLGSFCHRRASCDGLTVAAHRGAMLNARSRGSMAAQETKADETAPRAMAPRYDETFPILTAKEIDRLRRFGAPHRYSDGEKLIETGKP